MRNIKLLWAIIGCLVLLAAIQGWNYNKLVGSRSVAVIGNVSITEAELTRELRQKYGKFVLDQMINRQAVFLQAERMGLTISEEQLEEELKKVKNRYLSTDTFLQMLKKDVGLTQDEIREDIRYYLLLEKIATMDIEISDQDAFDYYEQNYQKYNRPPMARISAIYIDSKAEAEQVIQEWMKGAHFNTLAKEWSQDVFSSANGGDLGWVSLLNGGADIDQELLDAALTMEVGKISEPIALEKGFAVIIVQEKKEPVLRKFEEVKEEIKREMALQQVGSLDDVLERLKEGLHVEVYPL